MAPPQVEETKIPFEDITYNSLTTNEDTSADKTEDKNKPGSSLFLYLAACTGKN